MAVVNKIGKVMRRNHALANFDQERIVRALRRAADSIGGFDQDYLPGINDPIFAASGIDNAIAEFLSDLIVICLNAEPHRLVSNFPPTIEEIQDTVLHVLRSYGFDITADAYSCFRWGHHWLREGSITEDQFVRNGYPPEYLSLLLAWNKQHNCDTTTHLNEVVQVGKIKHLIEDALAYYEASLDEAADKVMARINAGNDIKMIWISGPSSSGKTTTTVKLTKRLEKRGLRFLMLNLDDYFWPLTEHPTDWINDRNYETPEALDIQLLNEHLRALLDGEAIDKPVYSFKEGRRSNTKRIQREPGQVLLLDCLHGFYPPITEHIDPKVMFRLYIEAMNPLYEGDGTAHRLTRFEDVRLLRRMLRDIRHRHHHPLSTILHWHYVRMGELFSIIPLKGLADHIVNGGMPFDLPALKPFFSGSQTFWPHSRDLVQYPSLLDAHIRHARVEKLLQSISGLSRSAVEGFDLIPGDAMVREFIGGSTVKIPHNE